MDAVTYPNTTVSTFITDNLIALRIPFDQQPLAGQFNVTWTPTIIILDSAGVEHHRAVGFQTAEEFVPFLALGIAKIFFDQNNFPEAISRLESLAASHPLSTAAPEALFHLGVARYKSTHDPSHLKAAHEVLKNDYPGSDWTKRSQPYALL